MSNFDIIIKKVLINEGGYSFRKDDPGGETKYGITAKTAYSHGYQGEMKDLTLEFAKKVYKASYYNKLYDEIADIVVAYKIFDAGVNMGVSHAVILMQSIVATKEDGVFGRITLNALNTLIKAQGGEYVVNEYCVAMKVRYSHLISRNSNLAVFQNGWYKRAESKL